MGAAPLLRAGGWRGPLVALASALLIATACQPTPPSASGSPGGTASASPVAKRGGGGELKILYWQAPTILNGHQATGTKDSDASRLVLEPLASFGKDGTPIANALASEIPTVANGAVTSDLTTVTWKLRQGVKWSDGSAFSADDVAFTFKYQCDEKTAASSFDRCENVDSVTAKDPNTVVVKYKTGQPFFYQWGVGFNGEILQQAQYKDCVGEKAANCPADQKPIGTGPYKVVSFKPGDNVQYELNDNYHDPNKPFFKTVTFKGGGDAVSAARGAFQTGDVDYAWNLQVEANVLRPMAQQSDKATLVTVYGSSVERVLVNFSDPRASAGANRGEPTTKHPFFSDMHVRRALAMATNRAAVAEQLYGNGLAGKATCNILTAPDNMVSKNTDSMDVCKFDVNAASKELEDAGWVKGSDGVRAKGGVKLEITYQTTVNALRQKTQDILKASWEQAGFKVNLKSVPADVFFTNTSPDGANHFWADVEMFTNSSDADPTSYFSAWTTSQLTGKANNWQFGNYNRYSNPDYDKLFDQLKKELDSSKRAQIAIQLNDILTKDVVNIPLINRTNTTSGVSKSLKGVDPSPWDSEMYNIQDWSK